MSTRPVSNPRWRRLLALFWVLQLAVFTPLYARNVEASVSDPIVIVVSVTNPLTSLSRREVADLYLGATQRFPNGKDAIAIEQPASSPDRVLFFAQFVGLSEAQVRAHWSKLIFTGRGRPLREVANGEAVRALIAKDPRVLGYLPTSLVDARLRVVQVF